MTEPYQAWRREPAEEYGFFDPWGTLRPYWRWIAVCAAAIAVAALGLSLRSPKVWEAEATILPGIFAQTGLLEPVPRSVERLRARSLGDAVLSKCGLSTAEKDPNAKLFRDSLKVVLPLNTDVIRITLRARSPQLAARLVEEMIASLQSVQEALLAPSLARIRQDLADVQKDLSVARDEKTRLENLREAEKAIAPANRFSQSVVLGGIIAGKTGEIQNLELRRLQLEEALNPAKSHGVTEVDKVHVKDRPVSPKPIRNTALGAFVGLFIGIFGVLLWKAARAGSAKDIPEASPRPTGDRSVRERSV